VKIFEQIITKKINLSEEGLLNKSYLKSAWDFYIAYGIAVAFLGLKDKLSRKKNRLFRIFIENPSLNNKIYNKFNKLMSEDYNIINLALNQIHKIVEETGSFGFDELNEPDVIGILDYEFPEGN